MDITQIDASFDYKEYIGRTRDHYMDQVETGGLSGDLLEAVKSMVVALTVAYNQA